MHISASAHRQGHRLLQFGALLFLAALLVGIAVPKFAVPRLGLSVHLLGVVQGILLILLGVLWPRLVFTPMVGGVGFVLILYGCLAAWTANLLAAISGAGNGMLPIAAGSAHGTPIQEGIIALALRSAAVSLIAAIVVVLWGLRRLPARDARD